MLGIGFTQGQDRGRLLVRVGDYGFLPQAFQYDTSEVFFSFFFLF